jgi:glyoxylase-like metal-dependent hydrolase (beta-lactamase superfamily II)
VPVIRELGSEVFELDTLMGGHAGITAGYLIRGERPCLVETGTARSAPVVRAALDSLGVGAEDLATIVVTHIHLDHAGGVGDLAAAYPRADVVVHERGARHLVDPGRLVASARRVFGAAMDSVFGDLAPTEASRVRAVGSVGTIELGGGRRLETHYSPGHAQHHIGLLDSATGDLYVGDAAGLYLADLDVVRASTPPPDFDLEASLASLDRFAALAPPRLLFSHFGPVRAVSEILDRSRAELHYWVEQVRDARRVAGDLDHAVELVRAKAAERHPQLHADRERGAEIEELSSVRANVMGIWRYLQERDVPGSVAQRAAAGGDGAGRPEPVVPERAADETDAAWGDPPEPGAERLTRERPPHHEDRG